MIISSIKNKKIKEIIKLKNKKYRDEYKMFIVEGEHLVKEAYKNNCLIEVFSLEQSGYENETIITPNVMKKIASLASSPSIIGICKMKDNDIIVGDKILILDNIQDPGNLGTIIRSAVAFNIDTIVLSTDTVSLYNEKTIRATQGMLFYANVITKNLKEFIPLLKNNGYKIYTTNVNNGISIKSAKFYNKCAIIMGNEGNGVSSYINDLCDGAIYIPMNKSCESLNVGVATSIILYEMSR